MQTKNFLIVVALLTVPFCVGFNQCNEKSILNEDFSIINTEGEKHHAYNGAHSCVSLDTTDPEVFCCYIKLKFKNELLDEKFTQTGCIEFNITDYAIDDFEFDDFEEMKRKEIQDHYDPDNEIDVKSIDIDCSANYLKFIGLAFILFFL